MLLIVARSSSLVAANTPSSKMKVLIIQARSGYSASAVPAIIYWAIMLVWGCCTCKPCSCALSASNTVFCSICNPWRAPSMTSQIVLLISNRSPSVSVIRLIEIFVAFHFFLGAIFSGSCDFLSCVDDAVGSAWSSSLATSPIYCPEDISWPSSASLVSVVVVFVIFVAVATSSAFAMWLLLVPSASSQPVAQGAAWCSSFVAKLRSSLFSPSLGSTTPKAMTPSL